VDYQVGKTRERSVRGHSDIDVVAIKSGQIILIECKSYWTQKTGTAFKKLKEQFRSSEKQFQKKFPFFKGRVKRILVTSGKPAKFSSTMQGRTH
jgi:hypothetical protein